MQPFSSHLQWVRTHFTKSRLNLIRRTGLLYPRDLQIRNTDALCYLCNAILASIFKNDMVLTLDRLARYLDKYEIHFIFDQPIVHIIISFIEVSIERTKIG